MSEIKHLLPKVARFFRANLHTHSTCSDGVLTPREIKEAYKARGYQIVAFTDHENDAAEILKNICQGENLSASDVKEGKIELSATCDGVFYVDEKCG